MIPHPWGVAGVNAVAARAVVSFAVCILLSGCQALAEMRAQHEAQRQAREDNFQERVAALTPDQKDAVQKCSSIAVGRIAALRKAGQGAGTYGMNDDAIADACLDNQYYYEVIPAPTGAVNAASPQPARDDGMGLHQQCLAAWAVGAGICR